MLTMYIQYVKINIMNGFAFRLNGGVALCRETNDQQCKKSDH